MQIWLSVILPAAGAAEGLRALKAQWLEGVELIAAGMVPADMPDVLYAEDAASALACARGRYVAFVKGSIAPDYLKALYAAVQTGGFDLMVFEQHRSTPGMAGPLQLARIRSEDLLEMYLRRPSRYGAENLLVSADYLRRAGLQQAIGDECGFVLRAFSGTQQILHTQACLCGRGPVTAFDPARLDLIDRPARLEPLRTLWPRLARRYERWLAARLYWSLLADAAAQLEPGAAQKFALESGAREQMARLQGHPDPIVRCGAGLYRICPAAWMLLARRFGRRMEIE